MAGNTEDDEEDEEGEEEHKKKQEECKSREGRNNGKDKQRKAGMNKSGKEIIRKKWNHRGEKL